MTCNRSAATTASYYTLMLQTLCLPLYILAALFLFRRRGLEVIAGGLIRLAHGRELASAHLATTVGPGGNEKRRLL